MVRPIVQVSLKDFEQRKQGITKELWDAANDVGFFYLKDHGLTEVGTNCRRGIFACYMTVVPNTDAQALRTLMTVVGLRMDIQLIESFTRRVIACRMKSNTCSACRRPSSTYRLT
jgi:hypothetical protein